MSKDTALLVIDVQTGLFHPDYPIHDGDAVVQRIQELIGKARSRQVPVVYVQHNEEAGEPLETGSPGWNIHPAIAPVEGDVIVQKRTPDSFHETNLQSELAEMGIRKLVVAGLQTDFCVNATSNQASSLGYEVVIASDAHSTCDQHEESAEEIIRRHNEKFRSFAELKQAADISF